DGPAGVGPNGLIEARRTPGWMRFLEHFTDVLVVLLLVAAAISAVLWLVERDSALPYEAIAIFAIVLINAFMGYVQQARAEQSLAALRRMSAATANVVRGGGRRTIPATQLVPGDIMLIEEGDTTPADGRLIQSTSLTVSEAALTGESEAVAKDAAPLDADAVLGDRRNMVYSGTTATYGRG